MTRAELKKIIEFINKEIKDNIETNDSISKNMIDLGFFDEFDFINIVELEDYQ